jgi:hypothetical protein
VNAGQGVESLAVPGEEREAQGNTALNAALAYEFLDGRARVGYDGAFGTYLAPGDWRFMSHEAGGRYRIDFGAAGKHHLYAGGSAVLRRNGSAWEAADYDALGGFANVELHPSATTVVRAGYRLDARRFSTSAALDHEQHTGSGSLLVNLPSRTTVIAEVTAGLKSYAGLPPAEYLVAMPPLEGATTAPLQGSGSHGTGAGWRTEAMGGLRFVPVAVPGLPATSAGLVAAYVRAAQSLADRVGLSAEVFRRSLFGDTPPAVVATPPRFFDDGVYDDPFASAQTLARVTLKGVPERGPSWSVSGSWQDKPYAATPALDDAGLPVPGVLRHDEVVRAGAWLSWPVAPGRTGNVDVAVVPAYDFTHHRSTTAGYNYTAHTFMVGVSVQM